SRRDPRAPPRGVDLGFRTRVLPSALHHQRRRLVAPLRPPLLLALAIQSGRSRPNHVHRSFPPSRAAAPDPGASSPISPTPVAHEDGSWWTGLPGSAG